MLGPIAVRVDGELVEIAARSGRCSRCLDEAAQQLQQALGPERFADLTTQAPRLALRDAEELALAAIDDRGDQPEPA